MGVVGVRGQEAGEVVVGNEGSPQAVNICLVKTHVPRIKDSRRTKNP